MNKFNKINIKAVLFDLEGTLIKSGVCIFSIVEFLAFEFKLKIKKNCALTDVYTSSDLIKLAFDIEDNILHNELLKKFHEKYNEMQQKNYTIIEGVLNVLNYIDTKKLLWGIVTNRTENSTKKLINELKWKPNCIVGCDSATLAKPHPEPIILATKIINVDIKNCIFVGDSQSDIMAAKSANVIPIQANYLNTNNIFTDYFITKPDELIQILEQ